MIVGEVINPEALPEDQNVVLAYGVFRVEDNGMQYDIELTRMTNSERNLRNGATAKELTSRRVWKVKKDGTRGMKLAYSNTRMWDVARSYSV